MYGIFILIVLRLALNTSGAPSPVDVSGPTVVDKPSLPGNPLGHTSPIGPGALCLPGDPDLPLCPRGSL